MKKIFATAILAIAFSATAKSQTDLDCRTIKNGQFIIEDSEMGNSYIKRKGSKQWEYGSLSKLKLLFKVEWLEDCSYTLSVKKVLENPNNIPVDNSLVLIVKVLEIKEDGSYIQESTLTGSDQKLKGELKKVEDLLVF